VYVEDSINNLRATPMGAVSLEAFDTVMPLLGQANRSERG
jgi:hypothetical protein